MLLAIFSATVIEFIFTYVRCPLEAVGDTRQHYEQRIRLAPGRIFQPLVPRVSQVGESSADLAAYHITVRCKVEPG